MYRSVSRSYFHRIVLFSVQLQYYSEKFEDFKSTLEKSNEIFTTYRAEIDKMGKKLKQAEKERAKLTKKWEDATRAATETMEYVSRAGMRKIASSHVGSGEHVAWEMFPFCFRLNPQIFL